MDTVLITVGKLDPAGEAAYAQYADAVLPLLDRAGGRMLGRFQFQEGLVGENFPDIVFAMSFPDTAAIRDVLSCDEYTRLIPLRDAAFCELKTFIGSGL
ncbi:hypothetical protein MNBD_GAMMA13-2150 [hydrothermal vent metagenome]|uniref:DUF1330 domain-containing protein n=1 Tax=hydrothermal vent metagenome TaxID=652676 RepID=A0A3B0YD80_9ZZZZ